MFHADVTCNAPKDRTLFNYNAIQDGWPKLREFLGLPAGNNHCSTMTTFRMKTKVRKLKISTTIFSTAANTKLKSILKFKLILPVMAMMLPNYRNNK